MYQYYFKLSWLSIKRTPMLTSLMVVAIGLGISVTMTVITLHYLMKKDPIPGKSEQLFHVQLFTYGKGNNNSNTKDGYPFQLTYQDAMNIHQSQVAGRKTRSMATGFTVVPAAKNVHPFTVPARAIDHDFFAMFKVPFVYGGSWQTSIDSEAQKVAVISTELNDRLYQGKNSVGQQIVLDLEVFTIVGVIDWRPTMRFYDLNNGPLGHEEDIFVPFSLLPVMELSSWGNNTGWKTEKVNTYQEKMQSEIMWIQYWVELNTTNQKQTYLDWLTAYIHNQKKFGRFDNEKAGATVKNVLQWMDVNKVVSDDNSILLGLAFLFLIVCLINTLGLLLAKFLRRAPEVGIRRALGASRQDIFLQHLFDVALIGFGGGILGLLLGQLGLLGIKSIFPYYEKIGNMDLTLFFTAIFIAVGASIIAGIFPAWRICQTSPSIYLKMQ